MLATRNIIVNQTNVLLSFQASTFLLPWLIVIWLTYNFDIQVVGEFTYLLAILSPLCLLIASPSRNFLISTDHFDFDEAHQFRNLFSICGLVIALLLAFFFNQPLLFFCVFLLKVTEFYFDLKIADYIREDNVYQLLILNVSKWIAIFAGGLLVLLSGTLLPGLVIVSILFFYLASKGQGRRMFACMRLNNAKVLAFLPLSLSALVFSLYFNIPRYFLGATGNEDLLAVFSISSFLVMGGLVFINSFMQAKIYVLKQAMRKGGSALNSVIMQSLGLMLLIYLAIQVFQFALVEDLFWSVHNHLTSGQPAYQKLYHDVLTLSWGPILFSVCNYVLIASGQHKSLLFITVLNSIFVFIVCKYLYIAYGVSGVLWAINLSGLLQACLIVAAFRYFAERE